MSWRSARALACAVALGAAMPANAQAPVSVNDAVQVFSDICLANRGNHAATTSAIGTARGFAVTDTSGGQGITNRVLARNNSKSVEVFAMQYQGADLCGVGFTPAGDKGQAQTDAAAKLAAALGFSPDAFKARGKELSIGFSDGGLKVVVDRVYPVSINLRTK